MNIKIGKSTLKGNIKVISSKSDAHRLLIAAALADHPTKILLEGWNNDIEATKNCMEALGCKIKRNGNGMEVMPLWVAETKDIVLDCGESGSTLRFLLPVVAALGKQAIVEGQGRLPERPIGILLEELRRHGCVVKEDSLPLEMSGGMRGGVFTLPGNVSSQFITGLLFALPLLEKDSQIRLTTKMESRGYVDMTLETLKAFGIIIDEQEWGFFIKGGQIYRSPREISAEGDWSGAAFWVVAGGIGGEINCTGLRKDSCQGDKEIVPIMERFGARVGWQENTVKVSSGKLRGIDIDAAQIPDLVPILCTAAALAEGKTLIYNAGRLRIKESDRLKAMAEGLQRLGVSVTQQPDSILIEGGNVMPSEEVVLDSYDDHRIVMALAIAAAALGVDAVIERAEAVSKSYPTFFAEFTRLGGAADVF
ncbi:3-phosphoshikimate 1-carboxyvinyltransferase [Anaerotignum neopropionicum]|uniref:3-phosphoshikimate 1-carboxyvinyltransferase n=1 Tax=Anaerotignum neopropionicum TaxID=36847 RepID=A0A136WFS5_9FIRM|nr:3-phosphoshikimate 1-carboxyvinyltransferase [Anaerotignum neopropionicum]KXL53354.1 3-phosphoshikimate 1-carboxyvinyltransferase [Anaerotignum neopropionicum]